MTAAHPSPVAAAPRTHRGPPRPQVVVDPEMFIRRSVTARSPASAPSVAAPIPDRQTALVRLDAVQDLHGRIAGLRRQVAFSRRLHANAPALMVRADGSDPAWALDLAEQQAWWGDLWFEAAMLRLDAAATVARSLEDDPRPERVAQLCAAVEETRKSFEEAAGHYRLVQRVHRRIRKRSWRVAVASP